MFRRPGDALDGRNRLGGWGGVLLRGAITDCVADCAAGSGKLPEHSKRAAGGNLYPLCARSVTVRIRAIGVVRHLLCRCSIAAIKSHEHKVV